MTGTELAINLGFIVTKEGKVFLKDDVACLDFHHLRDKEFNIANEIKNLSIDNLKKEIDKCIVLCANCHRKLHYYDLSIEELKRLHSVPEVA